MLRLFARLAALAAPFLALLAIFGVAEGASRATSATAAFAGARSGAFVLYPLLLSGDDHDGDCDHDGDDDEGHDGDCDHGGDGDEGHDGDCDHDGDDDEGHDGDDDDCGCDCSPSGRIGDLVWSDWDGDGLQDAGEPGIAGVVVVLLDEAGEPLAAATSDGTGHYAFEGLSAGTYLVTIDSTSVPAGNDPVPCDVGGDDTLDSDCVPAMAVLPHDDSVDETVDFGFRPVPFTYCDSNPNSTGQEGHLVGDGSTSIADNGFYLHGFGLPALEPCFFFYGFESTQVPFGPGYKCIADIHRYRKMQVGEDGTVSLHVDFAAPPLDAGPGAIHPGVPTYFQLWYRDPFGGPPGFNTTDAVGVTFTP